MSVDIKSGNKKEIIDIIRKHGPISVREITAISRLSVPCVTKYISDMHAENILVETIDTDTAAGRKPKVYSINSSCCTIIAVDLGDSPIKIGISDLSGGLLFDEPVVFTDENNPETCIDDVISSIRTMLSKNTLRLETVSCIVIGNPGVVDPASGTMQLNAGFAVWHELPIRKIFMDAFGKEVFVYNDVNLSAIGEKIYGVGKGYDNFIYIRADVGLKAGIMINGSLFEGERNAAGEFGLNYLIGNLPLHSYPPKIDRIESKLSINALIHEIRQRLPEKRDDILYRLSGAVPQQVTLDTVKKALDTPDTFVWELIEAYTRLLALSIANLTLTLDIGLIIFGGEIAQLNDQILVPMRQMLTQLLAHPPAVILSELGTNACLYGAISKGQDFTYQALI